ncbi:hypothetical protein BH10PLA2_BH10PLA2_16960 [soil metagenome]
MAQRPDSPVLRFLNRLFENHQIAGLPDRELLKRFAVDRDEDAFTLLVRRHGGMVLGVCHRLLGNTSDAEDAFQATFLVLAKKCSSIGWRDSVSNWLYGVALRVASKMRTQRTRQLAAAVQARSHSAEFSLPEEPTPGTDHRELAEKLDLALQSLPAKLRGPLVLCYLEGKSHQQAARELGLPSGSISRHLARGLECLRERLAKRDLLLSTEALGGLLASGIWRSFVDRSLVERTTQAALFYKLGTLAATGAASVRVLTVAKGVLRAMVFTQLKFFTAVVFTVSALGASFMLRDQPTVGGVSAQTATKNAKLEEQPENPAGTSSKADQQTSQVRFAGKLLKHQAMQDKLDQPVVLEKGFDIMTFNDAKQYLEDRFKVMILVNGQGFDGDVLEAKVKLEKISDVSLRSILEMLTAQFGATCLIHPEFIEVVKPELANPEAWMTGDRTAIPQVHADFRNTPLDKALRELALETGITVVLDQGIFTDNGSPHVTAFLDGTKLDTAVELLANMCGMKSVALDRALYVTSASKAEEMIQEREARRVAREKLEEKKQKEAEKAVAKNDKKPQKG